MRCHWFPLFWMVLTFIRKVLPTQVPNISDRSDGVSASHGKMAIAIQPSSCFGSFLSCRQSLILSTVSYLVLLIIGESRKRPVISKGFLNYISVRSGAFLHHCVLKGSYIQLRGSTMICTFCHQLGDALLSHTTPNDLT